MNSTARNRLAAALLAFSIASAHAGGGGFSGGALEVTQLANNAELVSIYSAEIEQIAQQLQMIQNMVQNTNQIPVQLWSSIEGYLIDLVNAIAGVRGVANASENAMALIEQQFGNGDLMNMHEERVREWNRGVNNQIGVALRNMGLNASQFQTRQQALAQIQAASKTATGRMQVLQAGNQIAGMMVNEIQALHSTIISAEQARLAAVAVEQNRKYQERKALEYFLRTPARGGF